MTSIMWRIVSALVGYLCGSFLTAEVVARAFTGKSARDIGTGNPGMANIMGNVGKLPGAIVLGGDLAKTALGCGLAVLLAGDSIGHAAILYGGVGAILGHDFPVWSRFRGGKGVAVTCAWLVIYLGLPGLACCIVGGVLVLALGYLPLAAVVMPLVAIPVAFVLEGAEGGLWMVVVTLVMLSRHHRGLRRIWNGTEPQKFRRKH